MSYLILVIPASLLGWFAYQLSLKALASFSLFLHKMRLIRSINPSQTHSLLQTLGFFMESKASFAAHVKFLDRYNRYLLGLSRRANRPDLKPATLILAQVLLSWTGALLIGFLLASGELAFIAFALGGALPVFWLRDQAVQREKELLGEMPNALEILSLCSEAGLSLEQAMDQYLRHSKLGALHDEFSIMLDQTKSGSNRKKALEAASARLNLADFTLFASSLIQAERFGTGVSQTLRQLSFSMRDKQTQRAEKAVQEMPVKMLLPLILFIMPVTFLVIFGPILIQFFHP